MEIIRNKVGLLLRYAVELYETSEFMNFSWQSTFSLNYQSFLVLNF
jgi:hypothetical protein